GRESDVTSGFRIGGVVPYADVSTNVSGVCVWSVCSKPTVVMRRLPGVERAPATVQDLREHLLRGHSWTWYHPHYFFNRTRLDRWGTAGISAADCRQHWLARLSCRRHQADPQLARPLRSRGRHCGTAEA